MIKLNKNFLKLQDNYLFSEVNKKMRQYKEKNGFLANQFASQDNFLAHYETTGKEIVEQLPEKVSAFVSGVGTGGTLMGIGKRLKEWDKNIKIVAHPKVQNMLINTSIKDLIWNRPISEVLEITKLLITDYSSICYNAFYQGAAVIFYQPDLEVYEKANGPLIPADDEYIGKRAFNKKELTSILNQKIKNGEILLEDLRDKQYEDIYKTINEFHDRKKYRKKI